MTAKQYKKLASIIEGKCENSFMAIEITDFLEVNFDNFNREKFMLACGFDKAYSYDELLGIYFDGIERIVNSNVKVYCHS